MKWDENPLYYKKFSARIEETLQAYKDKRISEKEYFARMNDLKKDYQEGYSDIKYPDNIKNQPDAQAFYGATVSAFTEAKGAYGERVDAGLSKEQIAELSLRVVEIVAKHTKVDWHDNLDVHNRIDQEVEDLLFDFTDANDIILNFGQIDKILREIKTVALSRY